MRAALAGGCAALLALVVGCKFLSDAKPRVERFECQVRALEPLVGDVLDAEQLVRDVYAGKASLANVLANIEATQDELKALMLALRGCEPPPPEPELPQGVVSSVDAGSGGAAS